MTSAVKIKNLHKSFGSLIEVGESEKLGELILYYSSLSSIELGEKGENARKYIVSNFEKEKYGWNKRFFNYGLFPVRRI